MQEQMEQIKVETTSGETPQTVMDESDKKKKKAEIMITNTAPSSKIKDTSSSIHNNKCDQCSFTSSTRITLKNT